MHVKRCIDLLMLGISDPNSVHKVLYFSVHGRHYYYYNKPFFFNPIHILFVHDFEEILRQYANHLEHAFLFG